MFHSICCKVIEYGTRRYWGIQQGHSGNWSRTILRHVRGGYVANCMISSSGNHLDCPIPYNCIGSKVGSERSKEKSARGDSGIDQEGCRRPNSRPTGRDQIYAGTEEMATLSRHASTASSSYCCIPATIVYVLGTQPRDVRWKIRVWRIRCRRVNWISTI